MWLQLNYIITTTNQFHVYCTLKLSAPEKVYRIKFQCCGSGSGHFLLQGYLSRHRGSDPDPEQASFEEHLSTKKLIIIIIIIIIIINRISARIVIQKRREKDPSFNK
jgi:hypothetical protein